MKNIYVEQRLAGIQTILNGVHQQGSALSASSRGSERQGFIDDFLSRVLPPIFRFGTGDATDSQGNRSGQLDVVVEYPIAPTLPSVGGSAPTRLYLAEAVAAVIEVKSNVSSQWSEAQRTSDLLSPLRRSYGASMTMGGFPPSPTIPLFVAGYTGWKTMSSVQSHLNANPNVSGILVIDAGLFASSSQFGAVQATGPWALWGLIGILHLITNSLQAASTNPFDYAM